MSYDGSVKFDTSMDVGGFQQSANRLTGIVQGCGAFKLLEKGMQLVSESIDSAVTRYDTLQKFPKVLEQMGFSAAEASDATQKLSDGVQGLPTTLDSVVSTAQRLTVLTSNLSRATDTTLALNNAFLASGSSSGDASRGLEQYVQMLSSGKVDMQSWRTLQETMGLALNETANAFGYAGTSAQNDLYAALQSGEVTFDQFNNKIIELNNGVDGFAARAKTSTGGIGTAWANLSTAVVRGSTTLIEAVDSGLSQTKFKSIENTIQTTGKTINKVMVSLAPAAELVAANLDKIVVVSASVVTGFESYKAVTAAVTMFKAFSAAVAAVNTIMTANNAIVLGDAASHAMLVAALNNASTAKAVEAAVTAKGLVFDGAKNLLTKEGTVATAAETTAILSSAGAITAKNVLLAVLGGKLGIVTAAQWLWNAAMMANPIGLIVGLVAGLSVAVGAAAVAIYNAVHKDSQAYTEDKQAVEDLAAAQQDLADSAQASAKSYTEKTKGIRTETDASKALAQQLDALAQKEKRTAAEKKQLAAYVEELNAQQEGLNLAYDEENDCLNLNTAQIQQYIAAKQTISQSNALLERQNELYQEEATLTANINELATQRTTVDDQLAAGLITQAEYNGLCADLNDTRAAYIEQESVIADQKAEIDAQVATLDTASAQAIIDNAETVAAAQEAEMQRRRDALQTYTDAATNMFNRIDTTSDLSVQNMIDNLQHNQEAVAAWADNLVALGQRGLDDGLLQQLRDAGPESAATVAELVGATDEQLDKLSEVYRNGADTATDALLTELGLPEVTNSGSDMVDDIADGVDSNQSLKESTISMVNATKSAADQAVSNAGFHSVGQNMIAGITAGVCDGTSELVVAMRAAIQAAVAAAQAAADIHSPSKLMRRLIGLNLMKGWQLGILDGQDLLTAAMEDTVQKMRDAAESTPLNLPAITAQYITTTNAVTQSGWAEKADTFTGGNAAVLDGRDIVLQLDGREVARATAPYLDDQLNF